MLQPPLTLQSAAAIVRLGATDQVIISAVATCASLYLKTMIAKQNHCIENSEGLIGRTYLLSNGAVEEANVIDPAAK